MPAAGPRALAVAVYSDSTGETHAARESGVEGVACVDDAARAFMLLTRLWIATGNGVLRSWAEGLLDFVLWMHDGDGQWVNFIYDWDGRRNVDGPTSMPGPNFWQARATLALTAAATQLKSVRARPLLRQAIDSAAQSHPPADVRAIHALAAVELLRAKPEPALSARLNAWCDELLSCREGAMLLNAPDERGQPHLWGHVQEAALVDSAVVLGRPQLVADARRSAHAVFEGAIESGFDLPHVHPYDVQSAVLVMDRMAAATGEGVYVALAGKARDWFDGRNPAGVAVYDRMEGQVADGIDEGVLNAHSGAEANISAGLALCDEAAVLDRAAAWPISLAAGTDGLLR
ncbi:MAG TPA: hypothetical protein VIN56_03640 [Candidatus Dormibacteraeota bacterium]